MNWEAYTTIALALAMVVAMVRGLAPDMVLLAGLAILLALGVLGPAEAFTGFSNTGTLTVAVLFVVAAGVQETGGLDAIAGRLLGQPRTVRGAQLRMMLPVSAASAFINNTPLVAMMLPIVMGWSRRIGVSPSKLLIPLSYAALVGGTCTIIGTATNLVVLGLALQRAPDLHVPMFEVGLVGLPVALASLAYMLVASPWLLPDRGARQQAVESAREYTVAMRVQPGSGIVGKTIEEAGLRRLPGLFLIDIERAHGGVRAAPGPHVRLFENDRILLAGIVDGVVDLQRIRGLVPAEEAVNKLAEPRPDRRLVEAVVAAGSPLIHQNIREFGFRTRYNAAIIAVNRQGERLRSRIGDIVPQPGDTLLLEAHPSFVEGFRHDPTFALVSEVADSAPRRHERAPIAAALLVAMVAANAFGFIDLLPAALLAAGAMIASRCLTVDQARRSLELNVLLAIAASFAIGVALDKTGAAAAIANRLVEFARPFGATGLIAAIYVATAALSAIVTSKASVVLMFPIAHAATVEAGLDFRPFMYALMLAGSANFMTPISYQTNLMVYGPGRYRFGDFVRFGFPLQVIAGVVTVAATRLAWP